MRLGGDVGGGGEVVPELDAFFAEDRLDGFFVKNLENVQGDEREVMIFQCWLRPR